jgi:hypothetical protein
MCRRLVALLILVALAGCAEGPTWTRTPNGCPAGPYDNPVLIPVANHEVVWEGVVDVVGDYFRIDREEPVRLLGTTLTEGRIDTYPKPGATYLEPWENDSANSYERLESTLQSIRRRAVVKVIPSQQGGGFWIDVAVFKELENVLSPEHSTAGAATFRFDNSLTRVVNPELAPNRNQAWIDQGRDTALEQRILGQLIFRFTPQGSPIPLQ